MQLPIKDFQKKSKLETSLPLEIIQQTMHKALRNKRLYCNKLQFFNTALENAMLV